MSVFSDCTALFQNLNLKKCVAQCKADRAEHNNPKSKI
jgi:hypothetical protein